METVKLKRLLAHSTSLVLVIPRPWIEKSGWSQETVLQMEFLPARNTIIITESKAELKRRSNYRDEKVSSIVEVE